MHRPYLAIAAREASVAAAREVLTTVAAARLHLWAGGPAPASVADRVPTWLPSLPVD